MAARSFRRSCSASHRGGRPGWRIAYRVNSVLTRNQRRSSGPTDEVSSAILALPRQGRGRP